MREKLRDQITPHLFITELRTIAADPKHLGAEIGFFAVLHSWGQNLSFHPHLHCVVPGGGLSPDGTRWISCRSGFLLPVKVLSKLFRRLFLQALEKAYHAGGLQFFSALQSLDEPAAFRRYLDPARRTNWVVYSKRPFAGALQVLDYVGRYTHRVAISNNRLLDIEDGQVRFRWKDYRVGSQQKIMTLTADEFVRRFLIHVPPHGFQRIRYYGLFGNRYRNGKLARCRELLGMTKPETQPTDDAADEDYRKKVIGNSPVKIAAEAAVREGWDAFIGPEGAFVGMKSFGASGPAKDVFKHFDITADAVVAVGDGLAQGVPERAGTLLDPSDLVMFASKF